MMMVCSGASELAMAQWASAYAESALGFSKAVGDIAGPCMFAVTMGISRVLFGKAGDKMNLNKFNSMTIMNSIRNKLDFERLFIELRSTERTSFRFWY